MTATDKIYSYVNADWMICEDADGNTYLADKEFQLHETTDLNLYLAVNNVKNAKKRINTNVISAIRDSEATELLINRRDDTGIEVEWHEETRTNKITVTATGDIIENVLSFSTPYNGGFLYTVKNTLYRYDMESGTSTQIETGYGNYTEDYDNWGATYHAGFYPLDTGVFVLRYNIEYNDGGTSYYMMIVNDKGTVLFGSEINAIETLNKNYLGKYDDALYDIAGSTQIEDNYFLTKTDGSHFLIQFVRSENGSDGDDGEAKSNDDTRVVDNLWSFSLLSPFILDFANGSEITVAIGDEVIPSEYYVYDSEAQSLKLLTRVFDSVNNLYETMQNDGYFEITVTADEKTVILRIEVSPFSNTF